MNGRDRAKRTGVNTCFSSWAFIPACASQTSRGSRCPTCAGATLKETKTGKQTNLPLSRKVQGVIRRELKGYPADQYIFLSPHRTKPTERHPERRQGNEKPIDRKTAYNYVNEISREIGIDFKIGCHTLRKTFGYHFYKKTGKIGLLTIWFNHSSEQVTKRYIGIDLDEMAGYAKNFEI